MTARDDLADAIRGGYEAESQAPTQQEIDELIDRHHAQALREAADFVRDAHYRDGLSVQEIGTALRLTAADLFVEGDDGA